MNADNCMLGIAYLGVLTLGALASHFNAKSAYFRGWYDGWNSLRKEFREYDAECRARKERERNVD